MASWRLLTSRASLADAAAVLPSMAGLLLSCSAGPGPAGSLGEARRDPPGTVSDPPYTSARQLLVRHKGVVQANMHVTVVYVGDERADGAPNYDSFVSWVLASDIYWGVLAQYGVGYGVFDGSVRVPTAAFFTPDMLSNSGWLSFDTLGTQIQGFVHAAGNTIVPNATGMGPSRGETYLFFLPDGVGVTFPDGSRSCSVFDGYHDIDNAFEPYSVIMGCGRDSLVIAHELAEMATDPYPFEGWATASDDSEVGDLCNQRVSAPVGFWRPTRLWSNADGACVPQ